MCRSGSLHDKCAGGCSQTKGHENVCGMTDVQDVGPPSQCELQFLIECTPGLMMVQCYPGHKHARVAVQWCLHGDPWVGWGRHGF